VNDPVLNPIRVLRRPACSRRALAIRHAACGLLLPLLLLGQAAQAADKVAAPARAKAASAVLTKAELQACFDQQEGVRVATAEVERERASLEASKAQLVSRSNELTAKMDSVDATKPEAVDAYNAEVAEREKAVDALQARVSAFNVKAEALRARQAAYVQSCGNRVYEEKDANQLRKNK
jgi:hypothetical protein